MTRHYIFDPGLGHLDLSHFKGLYMWLIFSILALIIALLIINYIKSCKKRNIIILIDTNGEWPHFEDHIELASYYNLDIKFQKFYCILCAYEYLKKNHKKVLLVWVRPYGTICSHSTHTKEDIEKYTQLEGVNNFYEMLIKSGGINQIPGIIMHSNNVNRLKPTSKRPNDLFLGSDGLLPSKFYELIKELTS